jgi:hypothetical protein
MWIRLVGLVLWVAYASASVAASCNVVGERHGQTVAVTVDGEPFVAIAKDDFKSISDNRKQLEQALREANAKLKEYQDLGATYEELKNKYADLNQRYSASLADSVRLNDAYKANGDKFIDLTRAYEKLVKDYDKLAGTYRDIAIDKGPLFRFDAGLGMIKNTVTNETDVSVMLGASMQKLKAWYLWYPDGYGLMVGTGFSF